MNAICRYHYWNARSKLIIRRILFLTGHVINFNFILFKDFISLFLDASFYTTVIWILFLTSKTYQKKKLKSNWLECFIITEITKGNKTDLSSWKIYHVWSLMSINKLPEALFWELRSDENKIYYKTKHVLTRWCLHSQILVIMNIFFRVHYSFIMNCFKP